MSKASKSSAAENSLWISSIDLTRQFWSIAVDGTVFFGAKLESFPEFYFVPVKKLRYRTKAVKAMLGGLKVMYTPHGVSVRIRLLFFHLVGSAKRRRAVDEKLCTYPGNDKLPLSGGASISTRRRPSRSSFFLSFT
jgi:hypothetical protein